MDYCLGFSFIKRQRLQTFTRTRVAPIKAWTNRLPDNSRVFVWGAKDLSTRVHARDLITVRVEDGFLRSVGLGAAFAPPVSWVFDSQGLHHWGHQPTDLETLLKTADFADEQREIGRSLIRVLRQHKVSKYNLRSANTPDELSRALARSNRAVLVIGQVADDAALQGIRTPVRSNCDLLASVRSMHPDACIVYKRHPDVSARLRSGADDNAEQWADVVIENVGLHDVLSHVEEVHVLNSLAGFEALVAGKMVVCHAQPFYAGWGLTHDVHPIARRSRSLDLCELVFCALSLYPTYVNPDTGEDMSVFEAIEYLLKARTQDNADGRRASMRLGRLYRYLRQWRLVA